MSNRRRASGAGTMRPSGAPLLRRRGSLLVLGGAAGGALALGGFVALNGRSVAAPAPAAVDLDGDTLTVDRPAIDLGRVPLNVEVPVVVRLLNQSRRVVALGTPVAEALEGC